VRERDLLQTVQNIEWKEQTGLGSGDMGKVHDKHRFPPFCMEEKMRGMERRSLTYLDSIRLPSERPPAAALCFTQTDVWERSLKEEQIQHLGTLGLILNVDSLKS